MLMLYEDYFTNPLWDNKEKNHYSKRTLSRHMYDHNKKASFNVGSVSYSAPIGILSMLMSLSTFIL